MHISQAQKYLQCFLESIIYADMHSSNFPEKNQNTTSLGRVYHKYFLANGVHGIPITY